MKTDVGYSGTKNPEQNYQNPPVENRDSPKIEQVNYSIGPKPFEVTIISGLKLEDRTDFEQDDPS